MSKTLLKISNVSKHFITSKNFFSSDNVLKAVDNVSLEIEEGETLGIVGESGCGKSTLGRSILRLTEPTSGSIYYDGENICNYSKAKMRDTRKEMQIIFQNPYSALSPRMTVMDIVKAPLDVYNIGTQAERIEKVIAMLEVVGLSKQHLRRYPHEFSGGQRQRIVIARALILNPKFIVCDEPVSALDVSVRSQVLNLMVDLQKERNLTYMFISHDLSVVKYICDRIAVMYLGELVEVGNKEDIYDHPMHPYTKALLSAIPIPDVDVKTNRIILKGDVPSPYNKPKGCPFCTRCPNVMDICKTEKPLLVDYGNGHMVSCYLKYEGRK